MAVLVAGMLLTGCSKDSEDNQETRKTMEEQTIKDVLKQNIVGSWILTGNYETSSTDGFVIDNGIVRNVDVEFLDWYNGVILQFNADGSVVLTYGEDTVTGKYAINEAPTQYRNINIIYDAQPRNIRLFTYFLAFFEGDFNTMYLVSSYYNISVARFRRM